MSRAYVALVLLALLAVFSTPARAADAGAASADAAAAPTDAGAGDASSDGDGGSHHDEDGRRKLRVGVAGDAPFVVKHDAEMFGIAVELFRAAAKESDLAFELVPVETVREGLEHVKDGDLDVLVGDVTITAARLEDMRFTQPYFQSSLGVMTRAGEGSYKEKVTPFFSRAFLYGTGVLLTVLCIVGTLIWVVERKKNPEQFPPSPARGIANGVWFALVTMTTVGYGDRAPVTGLGRVISGVWMVIALISASSLTAGIATALTLAQLSTGGVESIDQLARERVAVVSGTPAEDFVHHTRVRPIPVKTMEEGIRKLEAGEVKAVLFDRPQLLFYIKEHPDKDLSVSRASYMPQGYGFALPLATTHQHDLNVALVRLFEQGTTQKITTKWLGVEVER